VNCSPSLDRAACVFPGSVGQRGACAADRSFSSTGGSVSLFAMGRSFAGLAKARSVRPTRGLGLAYSGLMLAALITLPHFSVSSTMSLRKSAGEPEAHAQSHGSALDKLLAPAP
jgi:hypothetical protein